MPEGQQSFRESEQSHWKRSGASCCLRWGDSVGLRQCQRCCPPHPPTSHSIRDTAILGTGPRRPPSSCLAAL